MLEKVDNTFCISSPNSFNTNSIRCSVNNMASGKEG